MFDESNNPLTQTKETGESDKVSSYKNYMRESDRVINFKEAYEQLLFKLDPSSSLQRSQLIDCADMMSMELTLANDFEKGKFIEYTTALKDQDLKIKTTIRQLENNSQLLNDRNTAYMFNSYYSSFKAMGKLFLRQYIDTQARANLQFSTPKGLGEIEKFLKVTEVSQSYFPNQYGILISPQMELLCRGLFLRAVNNFDNMIIIDAKRGRGKSALALTIATTLSSMFHVPFDLEKHVLFAESRDYCKKLIAEVPRFTTLVFDQAGNQLNAKTSMDRDQVDFTNAQDLNRFHGLTSIFNWHDAIALDKDTRERIATHYITIETRGIANLKTFNLNPHNRGITSTQKERAQVVLTPEHAQATTSQEATTLFGVPYLPLEKKNTQIALDTWNRYSKRKEDSSIVMSQKRLKRRGKF